MISAIMILFFHCLIISVKLILVNVLRYVTMMEDISVLIMMYIDY